MDEAAKKRTLRMVPYGLYVMGARRIAVRDPAKDLHAAVVSWVTQVSFKPPMVAVGVKRDSHLHTLVKETQVFSLNFLGAAQKEVAAQFLKGSEATSLEISGFRYDLGLRTGCPVFPEMPCHLECEVVHVYEGENDHAVVVAKVVEAQSRRETHPLTTADAGWAYAG